MTEAIKGAKFLIDKQIGEGKIYTFGEAFSTYQKVYAATNENIAGYVNLVDTTNKEKVLSVLSSGDHVFNLITNDVFNIDTFDSNALTEYYALGLRRALILKYNYYDYFKAIVILTTSYSVDEVTEIIKGLLPYMEENHKIFWEQIINYNYRIQKLRLRKLNLLKMLCLTAEDVLIKNDYNNYLLNETTYEKLRTNLKLANISFKNCNALYLDKNFENKTYDAILLSNIIDYFYKAYGSLWGIDLFNKYVNKLIKLSNNNALLFLNYMYYYMPNSKFNPELIKCSTIKETDFEDEIVFPVVGERTRGGVILKKVNKE